MKAAPYIYNADEFIPGTTPVYYSGPYWDNEEIDAAVDSLKNGKWLVAGEKVAEFERAFAKKFNEAGAVMVNSGSSANLVMIAALKQYYGWPDGSEIIVSPVGFPTTISVIVQNGLKPVFADIEWHTLNFDLNKVNDAITPRTVGIFVSPVLGNPPDMDELKSIIEDTDIRIIMDSCDSMGSKWNGEYLNNIAVASSFSFYPAHHITTGEGGMITSNNPGILKIARSIAWWGRDCFCSGAGNLNPKGTCGKRFDKWLDGYDGLVDHRYVFNYMGYNLKPLDLQGAIGLVQLSKFDKIRDLRNYNHYEITGYALGICSSVGMKDLSDPAWFGVPLKTNKKRELVEHLERNKIQTRNYFAGNILFHPGYKHLDDYRKYPEANRVLDKVFFMGCSPHYTEKHLEYIEKVLKDFR